MRRWALAICIAASLPADAHQGVPQEHAILQLRPDTTEILYEMSFPAGAAAARWRLLFDEDRNGRLSATEYEHLAGGLAEALRSKIALKLEGNRIPLRVIDAKVTSTDAADGLSGPLAALVWLGTREIPPGTRKVDLEVTPLIDPMEPALIRLELGEAKLDSIQGGVHGKTDDGADAVRLRRGLHCTMIINVPRTNHPDAGVSESSRPGAGSP